MLIEINFHCFKYEHRMCWMLSSILQQIGDKPDIVVSISYLPNTGNPPTEECIKFFREKGLNIIDVPVQPGQEGNRAIARNTRAKETKADWIIFADGDMVYHKEFFADLQTKLQKDPHMSCDKVIGADRHSLNIEFCTKYFNEDTRQYPCVIEDVAELVCKWPLFRLSGKHIAPGYFQLANVQAIKNKGGIYSNRCVDRGRNCKTDRLFRFHMGGVLPIHLHPMFHLNHDRTDGIQR